MLEITFIKMTTNVDTLAKLLASHDAKSPEEKEKYVKGFSHFLRTTNLTAGAIFCPHCKKYVSLFSKCKVISLYHDMILGETTNSRKVF